MDVCYSSQRLFDFFIIVHFQNFLHIFINVVKLLQTLSDEKLEDSDIEPAPKLIEAVLQNCRGQVDQWLQPYLRITVERLRKTQKKYLKDLLMEVVRFLHCVVFVSWFKL